MNLVSFGGINNSSRFEGMGDRDSGRAVAISDDPMDNSIDVDGTVGPSECVFEKKDGILDLEAPVKEDSSTAAVISMKDKPLEAVGDLAVLPRTNGGVEVKANEDRPDGASTAKKDENFKAASGNSTLLGKSNDTSETVTNEVFQDADGAAILKKDEPLEAPTNSSIVVIGSNEKASGRKVGNGPANVGPQKLAVPRSSNYHGVTRHRWSGKFEAHLWDSSCRIEGRRRKGKQVYLGSYDSEEKAARAYDVAALKFWGASTKLNFPVSDYEKELEDIKNMTRVECISYLRRRSSCFARGASIYRGVTRRQKDGRWQARIGRVAGTKDIYLGTFKTEEEAAEAYDMACVELRGANAVTNFDISNYCEKGVRQLEGEALKQI